MKKRKIGILFVSFLLILSVVYNQILINATASISNWIDAADTSWYNDTDANFQIGTAEELAGLAKLVNEGNTFQGKTITLTNDIDLQNIEWTPIGNPGEGANHAQLGTSPKAFAGSFNGQSHLISNLKITKPTVSGLGLFGYCDYQSKIYNVNISNVSISGNDSIGAIIGQAGTRNGSQIDNCHISGYIDIKGGTYYAGGIVGHTISTSISNCSVKGMDDNQAVICNQGYFTGGIVGYIDINQNISDCIVENASIDGPIYVGGISGILQYGVKIKNCKVNQVKIFTADYDWDWVGGIVGTFTTNASSTQGIYDCQFMGDIYNKISHKIGKDALLGAALKSSYDIKDVENIDNKIKTNTGTYLTKPEDEFIMDGYKVFEVDDNSTTKYVVAPVLTDLKVNQTSVKLHKDESFELKATVVPAETLEPVSYASDHNDIASVDQDGKITAHNLGTATITVSAGTKTVTCQVSVEPIVIDVDSVVLSPVARTLKPEESFTLNATVLPSNATNKTVTFSSSDSSIASVDQNGKVTAHKVGTATITALAGQKKATCQVTVQTDIVDVESIVLTPSSETLKLGESFTLNATVLPSNASDQTVTFTSSDNTIASVDQNGKVTGLKVGTVTITAVAGQKKATCLVKVQKDIIDVDSVVLSPVARTLKPEESFTLNATVLPSNATNKTVTFSSSDSSIASVDQNGKVTAHKVGTATITALAGQKKATCQVTVQTDIVDVESIVLTPSSETLKLGESFTLNATVLPSNASDQTVTFTSSDNTIASVDQNGKVTGLKVGTVTITALAGQKKASCQVTVEPLSQSTFFVDFNTNNNATDQNVLFDLDYQHVTESITDTTHNILNTLLNDETFQYVDQKTHDHLKELYEDDKDIYLEVKTDLIQHSEVEKDVLKKVESYCQKNSTDFNVLVQQYFDISILVKSDEDVVGTLNKLDHPVSFTLKIPEGMKQSGRKLSVLRIHEGYVEELDTVMLSDDVLMFNTDRFSTYVLVSKEDVQNVETEKPQTESTESTSQSTQSSQQNQSPETGDEQSISLYVTLCTLSLVVGIVAIYLHRRKNI